MSGGSRIARVAFVLPQPTLRGWQREAIDLVADEFDVQVCVLRDVPALAPRGSDAVWMRAFQFFDRSRTSGRYRRVFGPSQVNGDCSTVGTDDLEAAVAGADVVVDLTGNPAGLGALLPRPPRFGIWSLVSDGLPLADGEGVGLSPLVKREPTGLVTLVANQADGSSHPLWRAEVRAHPTSPAVTEHKLLTAAVPGPLEALRRFNRLGSLASAALEPPPVSDAPSDAPMGSTMPALAFSMARTIANQFQRSSEERWSVATLPPGPFPPGPEELAQARWFAPDRGRSLADPFAIERDGETWVFVEEFAPRDKGRIAVMKLGADRDLSAPRKVLETDYHLSFPQVFEHDGRVYMLPEQSERGDVVLYVASDFPDGWREHRVLLPGFPGIDPVLHHDGRRWWLFVTYGGYLNEDNNLFVYFADRLEDEFRPHLQNPVKLDIRGSRMAGQLVSLDGQLYRPSQNCSRRYGGSITFHRIDELTATVFRETLVRETFLTTGPFSEGFHTFNRTAHSTLIDGRATSTGGR